MKIDVRNKKYRHFIKELRCFNADTGQEIRAVVWADVAKGVYGLHRKDSSGNFILNAARDAIIVDTKRGNIELRSR